jgi:PAS domain S-box-containing protein
LSDRPDVSACAYPPAAAWWTDAAGAFVALSPRWQAWTGRDLEKELGSGWLDAVHPEDRSIWERALDAARVAGRELRCDLRLRASAHWRWVRMHGVPQRDARGRLTGYVGSATDISDLKRAAVESDELLQAAVHDLRAPLRNLEHTLEHALRAPDRELLERARGLARSLSDLLRDLCAYTDAGRSEPAAQGVDAAEALAWACANLEPLIEQTRAEIAAGPLPRVWADPVHVGRVFQNLLCNALLYSGGAAPRVRISARRKAGEVRFAVQDDGVGIPADAHERVFRAFERLSSPEVPGSGLGLAICRRLVELHGGRIWLDSRPGSGSTFYFTLPADE